MSKIKVLEMIQTSGIGGAETVLYNIASQADKSQFDIKVLIVGTGILIDKLSQEGIDVYAFDFKRSYNLDLVKYIRALVRKHDIDIVHSHLSRMNMYGFLGSCRTGAKNIMTVHGLTEFKSAFGRFYYTLFGNLTGKIVTVSHILAREFLRSTLVRKNKVTVIPNGINIERFGKDIDTAATKRRFGLEEDAFVILAVGNIRAIKGYDFLIESFARIETIAKKPVLVICGNDFAGERAGLERLGGNLGVSDRVIFTDFVSDIESVYGIADLYVLSSITEGFSLTTLEAMASRLPVISTDCVGPREIIDSGNDGLIIPGRDPDTFAAGINQLISDSSLRQSFGEAAFRKVQEKYLLSSSIMKYEELFELLKYQ